MPPVTKIATDPRRCARTAQKRTAVADDPWNLLAVDGSSNRLWVTAGERDAIARVPAAGAAAQLSR
jgi:hypothetical protein